jgi:hypothetical protein
MVSKCKVTAGERWIGITGIIFCHADANVSVETWLSFSDLANQGSFIDSYLAAVAPIARRKQKALYSAKSGYATYLYAAA